MMLVAVVTSPDPHGANQEWTWIDWLVVASGCGFFLVFIARKYSNLKKQVLAKRGRGGLEKNHKEGGNVPRNLCRVLKKLKGKRESGKGNRLAFL